MHSIYSHTMVNSLENGLRQSKRRIVVVVANDCIKGGHTCMWDANIYMFQYVYRWMECESVNSYTNGELYYVVIR